MRSPCNLVRSEGVGALSVMMRVRAKRGCM